MKALVYTGTQMSEIRDVDVPVVGDNQVLVDLAFCGICGSDMHAWHGHDERRVPPLVLGHEAVGIVQVGPLAGKRVAINPLMTCGDCDFCNSGDEHLCPSRELIGMRVPGAFAEKLAIDAGNLTVIDDDLPFAEAALAEPLACSVHAVRLACKLAGDNRDAAIVVLGGGAIGLLAALVFDAYGYSNIQIAETNALRRDMLEKIGVMRTYDPLCEAPDSSQVDIIIDAVGSGATRRAASGLVRPGGVIVHIGLQDNEPGLDTRRITLQEINFQGTYCYRKDDFAEALALLTSGKVSGKGWAEIRHLDEGAQSFLDIHQGKAPPKIILQTGKE
ncbi:alcohol dehydrogenase catalytic domain-containing protein [bacterium]|jgi:2-desacetyl-2-hydroxyethyl bacteriochlorophyllide A dehydrogenase|nr:alcohol dehydrogenase catalytic domain-containing protein [bacterium]